MPPATGRLPAVYPINQGTEGTESTRLYGSPQCSLTWHGPHLAPIAVLHFERMARTRPLERIRFVGEINCGAHGNALIQHNLQMGWGGLVSLFGDNQ